MDQRAPDQRAGEFFKEDRQQEMMQGSPRPHDQIGRVAQRRVGRNSDHIARHDIGPCA
jgi:hypothetical protein